MTDIDPHFRAIQLLTNSRTPALRELVAYAARVAQSNAGILIQGESGTGKEVMARLVHAASKRADGPFVTLNCGAHQ